MGIDNLPVQDECSPLMADDIFYGSSMADLKKRIGNLVDRDTRSLPPKAKVFSAVANIQKFDMLPDIAPAEQITKMAAESGRIELQRGISSNSGVSAKIYAAELVRGNLFPGTLTAFGQGIYLATPCRDYNEHLAFPKFSIVAHKYAKKSNPGVIVRCILKEDANIQDSDELAQFLKENKSRAKAVFGTPDLGTFAAALGIDGYHCGSIEHPNETTYVILNRAALIFQTIALQISPETPNLPL